MNYVADDAAAISARVTWVAKAMAAFQSAVDAMAKPTSTRPIPLSALRHQQQRIGLFVPRGG